MLDSQSVKTTQSGGPRGHDAGKKVKGRKRHALVDTDGRALVLQADAASIQDRDGALPLLKDSHRAFPFIECAFADSAYGADRVAHATRIAIEIVRKHPDQIGFAVDPRRWVVERFSRGLTAIVGSPRTSKPALLRPRPSSTPLQRCSSPAD